MAVGRGDQLADSIHGDDPSGFAFVGMTGLLDPARSEVIEAVDKCHDAGIRVIMVTGGHAATASAIAEQVHVDRFPGEKSRTLTAHTGQELEDLSDEHLDDVFSNEVLLIGVLTSLLLHITALYLPWTQTLLDFQPLPWQVWIAAILVASTAIIVNELHKWLRPTNFNTNNYEQEES